MTKLEIARRVSKLVVGYGSGIIVKTIINQLVGPQARIDRKVAVYLATSMIASHVAVRAERQIDVTIDMIVRHYEELKKELQK
jgi:hypothetical protein